MRLCWLPCLFLTLFAIGCNEAPDASLLHMQDKPSAFMENVMQVLAAQPTEPTRCDQATLPLQEAIIEGLHRHGGGIAEAQKSYSRQMQRTGFDVHQVGPLTIVAPPEQWVRDHYTPSHHYGWPLLEPAVAAARNSRDWFFIFRASQSILMDDIKRRLHGLSMTLDAQSLAHAQHLQCALYTCLGDIHCTELPEGEHMGALNPTYGKLHADIARAQTVQMKRALLRQLAKQVDRDVDAQNFIVNESITVEGNTLWVPMDPGPFAGDEAALAEFIEPIWQIGPTRVQIRWTSRANHPQAYRFEAHPYAGRAFVDPHGRTVNIFNGDSPKTIAHEFGHVLGLPDHYYTTWSDATCSYTSTTDDTDIMSNHETGRVTQALWRELADVYGLPVTLP